MSAGIFRAPGIDQDSHMAATKRDLEMITHFAFFLSVELYMRLLILNCFPSFAFPSLYVPSKTY